MSYSELSSIEFSAVFITNSGMLDDLRTRIGRLSQEI